MQRYFKNITKKVFFTALIGILSLSFSGCFYLILGTAAAAGGYAVSKDTIQGETERDFDDIWNAAADVTSIMGTVNSKNRDLGKITAVISGAKVTVSVMQLTSSTTRLKVKARKSLFPSIDNAQNIYVKIMNRANE